MNTSNHTTNSQLIIRDIEVQLVRKAIKNVHIGVYPPNGRVRVSAPNHISDDNVRLAIVSKLSWIKKKQAAFQNQVRQSQREMVTGESHYFWGRRYRLEGIERYGRHEIVIKNNQKLILYVKPNTSRTNRELVLTEWYRAALKERVSALVSKWEPRVGKQVAEWRIKKMKTKWGSCTIDARRIWLNLELAKKPPECLEYILVHELVHLLERHHNDRFREHMDRLMPSWRFHRDVLNQSPLAHEEWGY